MSSDQGDPYNWNDTSTKDGWVKTGQQLADIGRVPEWRHGMSHDQYQSVVEGFNNGKKN